MGKTRIKFSKSSALIFSILFFYIGFEFIPMDRPLSSWGMGILFAYIGTVHRWKVIEVEGNNIYVHYIMRFFNRVHKYTFSDVVMVKYEHLQSIGTIPFFIFIFKREHKLFFFNKRYCFMIPSSLGESPTVKDILQIFKNNGCAYEIIGSSNNEIEPD